MSAKTTSFTPMGARSWMVGGAITILAVLAFVPCGSAADEWPPMPRLEIELGAADAVPLPPSVVAEQMAPNEWLCTFRYRPAPAATRVHLVGSFDNWDREAHPLQRAAGDGEWTAQLKLPTGVYQYKFLVNADEWYSDPMNVEQAPDSHGGFNSVVRLGRLACMRASDGTLGDGRISTMGLAHQPPQPLFIQRLADDQVSIRYRTLAHDVRQVYLLQREGGEQPMEVISEGPLFAFWESRVIVPATAGANAARPRSVEYAFALDDGAGRISDPYAYHYTVAPQPRLCIPDWAHHAAWYQVMLDRFRNGDPGNDPDPVRPWTSEWFTASPWEGRDGQTFYENFVYDRFYGGDLAGLEAQLPYLKELGVNALYLTPVFKAPSYHKYDVQNYVHIDDGFGTRGDYDKAVAKEDLLDPATWQWTETDQRFLAFLAKAHAQGFKVILDAVFNHVGAQHPAFEDVLKNGKRSRYADWFEVTSWEPFAYKGWAGFAHMPVFRKSQYGFASPGVKKHLFDVTRRWMDPNGDGDPADGIDGWRLDVPDGIPGTFWAEWRQYVKQINADALIVGEVWRRADQWLDGNHFDAVMNYEFARTAVAWLFDRETKITASEAAARFAELRLAYPREVTFGLQNLVSSHDTDRLASMAFNPDREYDAQNRVQDENPGYNNDKPNPEAYARARLAALLQVTYIGTPLIYYGDEAGMWGADDPSNRKPMLWKDLEPYAEPALNAVMPDQLAYYRQILALRNTHAALRMGAFTPVLADDAADVFVFLRTSAEEHVLVVLNASNAPRVVHAPLPAGAPPAWRVVFGGTGERTAASGKLTVEVPPVAGVVLRAAVE